ncbi:MAG: carboxypeptidase-like regulatory domain-containing protein [Gemmatimonadetes bacterium]|nr:carboxypeptidase-like regulatory domain-containing protein [Gemmatimonadota bacterium]
MITLCLHRLRRTTLVRRHSVSHASGTVRAVACSAGALLAMLMLTSSATAQAVRGIDPAQVPPGLIAGIVEDSLGNPVEDALVTLYELRRQARTRADGSFRFDSVKNGTYRVGARKLGYIGAGASVTVGRTGGWAGLRLIPVTTTLAPMVTEADAMGLSGVIGDTAWRALGGVTVYVMATQHRVETDSLGQFAIPLAPGRYMVRLEKSGYAGQAIGVLVPERGGRKLAAWLAPVDGTDAREIIRQRNLFDLDQRLQRASVVRLQTFAREELMRTGAVDAAVAAARATVQRYDPFACAVLDGGPAWAPLWSIGVDEIEFMEANIPIPQRPKNPVTSLRGMQSMNNSSGSMRDAQALGVGSGASCSYGIWLRK